MSEVVWTIVSIDTLSTYTLASSPYINMRTGYIKTAEFQLKDYLAPFTTYIQLQCNGIPLESFQVGVVTKVEKRNNIYYYTMNSLEYSLHQSRCKSVINGFVNSNTLIRNPDMITHNHLTLNDYISRIINLYPASKWYFPTTFTDMSGNIGASEYIPMTSTYLPEMMVSSISIYDVFTKLFSNICKLNYWYNASATNKTSSYTTTSLIQYGYTRDPITLNLDTEKFESNKKIEGSTGQPVDEVYVYNKDRNICGYANSKYTDSIANVSRYATGVTTAVYQLEGSYSQQELITYAARIWYDRNNNANGTYTLEFPSVITRFKEGDYFTGLGDHTIDPVMPYLSGVDLDPYEDARDSVWQISEITIKNNYTSVTVGSSYRSVFEELQGKLSEVRTIDMPLEQVTYLSGDIPLIPSVISTKSNTTTLLSSDNITNYDILSSDPLYLDAACNGDVTIDFKITDPIVKIDNSVNRELKTLQFATTTQCITLSPLETKTITLSNIDNIPAKYDHGDIKLEYHIDCNYPCENICADECDLVFAGATYTTLTDCFATVKTSLQSFINICNEYEAVTPIETAYCDLADEYFNSSNGIVNETITNTITALNNLEDIYDKCLLRFESIKEVIDSWYETASTLISNYEYFASTTWEFCSGTNREVYDKAKYFYDDTITNYKTICINLHDKFQTTIDALSNEYSGCVSENCADFIYIMKIKDFLSGLQTRYNFYYDQMDALDTGWNLFNTIVIQLLKNLNDATNCKSTCLGTCSSTYTTCTESCDALCKELNVNVLGPCNESTLKTAESYASSYYSLYLQGKDFYNLGNGTFLTRDELYQRYLEWKTPASDCSDCIAESKACKKDCSSYYPDSSTYCENYCEAYCDEIENQYIYTCSDGLNDAFKSLHEIFMNLYDILNVTIDDIKDMANSRYELYKELTTQLNWNSSNPYQSSAVYVALYEMAHGPKTGDPVSGQIPYHLTKMHENNICYMLESDGKTINFTPAQDTYSALLSKYNTIKSTYIDPISVLAYNEAYATCETLCKAVNMEFDADYIPDETMPTWYTETVSDLELLESDDRTKKYTTVEPFTTLSTTMVMKSWPGAPPIKNGGFIPKGHILFSLTNTHIYQKLKINSITLTATYYYYSDTPFLSAGRENTALFIGSTFDTNQDGYPIYAYISGVPNEKIKHCYGYYLTGFVSETNPTNMYATVSTKGYQTSKELFLIQKYDTFSVYKSTTGITEADEYFYSENKTDTRYFAKLVTPTVIAEEDKYRKITVTYNKDPNLYDTYFTVDVKPINREDGITQDDINTSIDRIRFYDAVKYTTSGSAIINRSDINPIYYENLQNDYKYNTGIMPKGVKTEDYMKYVELYINDRKAPISIVNDGTITLSNNLVNAPTDGVKTNDIFYFGTYTPNIISAKSAQRYELSLNISYNKYKNIAIYSTDNYT